jgi:hypothetical protein
MKGIIKCTVETDCGGMIYIQSFMKVGVGHQTILRFCLSSLKGFNVDITDDGDL